MHFEFGGDEVRLTGYLTLAGLAMLLGVTMLGYAIRDGMMRRRILVRHPTRYATGRDAVIVGVIMALLALVPLCGGTIGLLGLLQRLGQ